MSDSRTPIRPLKAAGNPTRRRGFTLMELVLVCFLIALAAGISIPVVDSLLHPNQVAASIDTVRAHLEQARSRAMEEGQAYAFSVDFGGSRFLIAPADETLDGFEIEGRLPDNCLFLQEAAGVIDSQMRPTDSGSTALVVAFQPDGAARDDAEIHFGRPGLPCVTLRVRALTGQVSQVRETLP